MKLFEVKNKQDYVDGYKYIKGLLPNANHALSCYSGISIKNTERILEYDINGKFIKDLDGKNKTRRVIATTDGKKIVGIAIVLDLPDFSMYLDYEKYYIILAENQRVFSTLFYNVADSVLRYELITFRRNERNYICNCKNSGILSEIHYWKTYKIVGKKHSITIRKPSEFELGNLKQNKFPIDVHPARYSFFEQKGINEYSVWVLPDEENHPIAICSLLPYCNGYTEIKLWYDTYAAQENIKKIVLLIEKSIYMNNSKKKCGVWRIKNSSEIEKLLIQVGKFNCIASEQHLHYKKIEC